ncbi:MAG: CPBP family intramembrane metalloprotease [Firmicutes bacterium]|nr:CPBP family intramembrane metalloprotease [Bacillota bacterium]
MTTPFQKKILRPYGKWSDILPLAWGIAFLLVPAGRLLGQLLLRIPQVSSALPASLSEYIGVWILCLAVILLYPPDRPMRRAISYNRRGNTLRMGLAGLLTGLGLSSLCILFAVLTGSSDLTFHPMDLLPLAAALLGIFLRAGAEELVVRCFLYQKLRRRYRHPAAAILGSAVFSCLLHRLLFDASFAGMLQVLTAGLLFALIVYYYGSFWAVCGIHTGWDFSQDILFGAESGLAGAIVLAILCVLVIVRGRRRNGREDLWTEASRAYETV